MKAIFFRTIKTMIATNQNPMRGVGQNLKIVCAGPSCARGKAFFAELVKDTQPQDDLLGERVIERYLALSGMKCVSVERV